MKQWKLWLSVFLLLPVLHAGKLEAFDLLRLISPALVDHPIEVVIWVKEGVSAENETRILEQIGLGLAMWQEVPTSRLAFDIVSVVRSAGQPPRAPTQLLIIVGNAADLTSGSGSFPSGGNPGTLLGIVADHPDLDTRKITAHEIGHTIGIDHSTISLAFAPGTYPIMHFAIDGMAAGLIPDDIAAISTAYPDPLQPLAATTGTIRGRLVIAGTVIPVNGVNVVAVESAGAVPAVGRFSGPRTNPVGGLPAGVFELPGLAPGLYDVWYMDGHSYRGGLPGIVLPADGITNLDMRMGYQADNFPAFTSSAITVSAGHSTDLGDIPVTIDPMRFDGMLVGDLTNYATYNTPIGEILPNATAGTAYQLWLHIAGGLRDIAAETAGLPAGLSGAISGDTRSHNAGIHGNHFIHITGVPNTAGYKTIDIGLRDARGQRRGFAYNLVIGPEPANGLVARYPFAGNTQDISGNGHHAGNFGATFIADRNGNANQAISFDGVHNYLQLPDEHMFDLGEFTIIAILKLPEARVVDDWIISKGTRFGNFTLRRNGSDATRPGHGSYVHQSLAGNWSAIASREALPLNRFFCYAVSVSRDRFKAYVDGRLVRQAPRPATPHFSDAPVLIGAGGYYQRSEYFRGVIDDLSIYRGALDDAAVAQVCDSFITPAVAPHAPRRK